MTAAEPKGRPPRSWFEPHPGYDGPPIVLTCGRHTAGGRFIPKNVKLSPIARKRIRSGLMVADPSRDQREIYAMHMAQKRGRGSL